MKLLASILSKSVVLGLLTSLTGNNFAIRQDHASQGPTQKSLPELPQLKEPADKPEAIREAYEFAAQHPEVLDYIPCFCVCGRKFGHRSNADCFVKSRGVDQSSIVWTDHGGQCYVCISVARDAKQLYSEGKNVRTIRETIDLKYGATFKNKTDTPEPH